MPRLRLFCNNEFRLNVDGVAEDDESQLECMREALANMCMHADQFSPIHSCIHTYTDRIEFMNAGSFAVPIATEGQVAPLLSRPRNPSLAKMFRLARLAETVGFGMKKIFTWKKLTGKEASIHSEIDYSIVTFYLDVPFVSQGVKDKEMSKTDSENVQDNVKMSKTDGDTVPVTAPVTAPDTAPDTAPITTPVTAPDTAPITAPEQDSLDIIINMIKETPNIRKSDIAATLGITVRGVRYHIEKLKKDGRLFWEGNSRKGHWVLLEQDDNNQ